MFSQIIVYVFDRIAIKKFSRVIVETTRYVKRNTYPRFLDQVVSLSNTEKSKSPRLAPKRVKEQFMKLSYPSIVWNKSWEAHVKIRKTKRYMKMNRDKSTSIFPSVLTIGPNVRLICRAKIILAYCILVKKAMDNSRSKYLSPLILSMIVFTFLLESISAKSTVYSYRYL